jgi:imidazolonepropionase-like amidohydrolase
MQSRTIQLLGALFGLMASASLPPADVHAESLLIRNARLIDGTGAPPRPAVGILVRDGRIAAVAPDLTAPGTPVLDAGGATVLPGLIDAHVHLGVVPGSGQRHDPPEVERALRRRHLRAYLACGVTTVLDTHIDPAIARDIQMWLAAGEPGPRFLTLGPGFVTPGGYLSDVSPATATLEDVSARFVVLEELGAVGVKVFLERGFGLRSVWPIHSPEIQAAIVRTATARRLPIYVHAQREEDMTLALGMGARAIVHGGFYDAAPSEDFVRRMGESGVYLMTTFSLADAQAIGFHPERLDDPLVRLTVPALELATARDPASERFLARAQIGMAEPLVPQFVQGLAARLVLTEASMARRLESSQRAVGRFWAAGVPIVAGSDAGNWPIDPYHFHGPTTLREIQLLGAAGVPPADALASATRIPARMLRLDDEIGTVEVGKRADLVIVRDDPLRDLGALRTVAWTIKGGVARTPEEWMDSD